MTPLGEPHISCGYACRLLREELNSSLNIEKNASLNIEKNASLNIEKNSSLLEKNSSSNSLFSEEFFSTSRTF